MTRFLSDLLGLPAPELQRQLQGLERLTGHPNNDIRLSTEVRLAGRQLASHLGLDGQDTTPAELRSALKVRLHDDERRLQSHHQPDSLLRAIRPLLPSSPVFALKAGSARKMLLADPPRRAMKALGYRSFDSLLRHESAALIQAAACLTESAAWHKRSLQSQARLSAADFEQRPLSIEQPSSVRWQELAAGSDAPTVLRFVELGSVVVLPIQRPDLIRLSVSVVQAVNDVRSAAAYLQLHQLQPGFGKVVRSTALAVPEIPIEPLGRSLSWHSLQHFFERFRQDLDHELFAPLVSLEHLGWGNAEKLLARLDPALEFWSGAVHAGLSDNGLSVSGNLQDVLAGGQGTEHLQSGLQHEILLRYLQADHLRQAFVANIHQQLAPALALS